MVFHLAQVKYVILLHHLLQYNSAAHAYVSPRPSRFILSAMPALGDVVFIWFHFKKRKERKKNYERKELKLPEKLESENNRNKTTKKKTEIIKKKEKLKKKQKKNKNEINHKMKLKKIYMSALGHDKTVSF